MIGIALLSGGLDSGVATASFVAEPANDLRAALFCDYGQRAAEQEFRAAKRLAKHFSVSLHRYELPWLADLARLSCSRLVPGTGELPSATKAEPGDERSAQAVSHDDVDRIKHDDHRRRAWAMGVHRVRKRRPDLGDLRA